MKSNKPILVGGKIFDEYALSLAISPFYKPNSLSASVVMSLIPIRRENNEFEVLEGQEYKKNIIISDIFESNDSQVITTVGKVKAALQELINLKEL